MKGDLDTEKVAIDAVRPHPKNVRQGDIGAICESLKAHGQYRAIVAQRSTGHILAGNHTWKAAKQLGWSHITTHFIDCDDDAAMRILLADNRANDLASYDDAALAQVLKELAATDDGLAGTLFDGDALDRLIADIEMNLHDSNTLNQFTQVIKVPQYEIVGERPELHELADSTRANELKARINSTELPDDIRDFLITATQRHIVFNYRKIAEFYPHASSDVQRLMEDSALIIIDADDAIAKGYAVFAQQIDEIAEHDRN